MAKNSRRKQFEDEFRCHIERHSPAVVKAIRRLVSAAPPKVIKVILFEISSDWDEFPVNLLAMDDKAPNEVHFKSPFAGKLLGRSGALIPDGAIDQDAYEDAGIATFETGARILSEWFGECWHAAGGADFSLPAYIGHHDDSALFELRTKRWMKFSDVWP